VNDAYICDGLRTPFGRYGGMLAQVRPDDLAAVPIRALMGRNPHVDWGAIDDIIFGCANQAGEDNRNVARMAALLAGIPLEVPGTTVNRLCGSSLDAIAIGARAIKSGDAALILAGGVESMSRAPFVVGKAESAFARTLKLEDTTIVWRFINARFQEQFGTDSMPETAENVAEQYGIGRGDQDAFALRSQQRAAAAAANGLLAKEITGVCVPRGKGETGLIDTDEHPRPDTTLEALARLKPVVKDGGTVTAGNASGVNDGAGAVLLASEAAARRHGLIPRARIVAATAAGVPPRIMGMGPLPASQKLLQRTGLRLADIDFMELNEAFAAQALAVLRELGLPDDAAHVNPNGGAIAVGHPLGASGTRLAIGAVQHLQQNGARYAVCTMCIGVGQGISMLLERV
jgi:acetyl-CoA acyltransferase